jgi:multisubunit Na+/H+ antiporter MnhC subunit
MAALIFLSCFGAIAIFMFLGTKMTVLHEKYFGKGSVNEMVYPLIFALICISIIIELAVQF